MSHDLKFIGWKIAELFLYVGGFPFLFIGCWSSHASDWCHDRALRFQRTDNSGEPGK